MNRAQKISGRIQLERFIDQQRRKSTHSDDLRASMMSSLTNRNKNVELSLQNYVIGDQEYINEMESLKNIFSQYFLD